jgi:hypothetical protein
MAAAAQNGDTRAMTHRRSSAPAGAALAIVASFASLAVLPTAAAEGLTPFGPPGSTPPSPWHVSGLPQQTKPFTRFSIVEIDGRRAVKIEADESYGNLVHPVQLSAPAHLSWQWRVERPLANADLRQRSGDDTAVKVCAFFDEPIDNAPFADRQFLRIARGKTSEPVPGATVCYVWDSHLPSGTAHDNAFTRRVRYIVLESGDDRLNRWVAERRDLGADFLRLFKDESPTVPPIIGIAIGADADNTHAHSISYVSGLSLEP